MPTPIATEASSNKYGGRKYSTNMAAKAMHVFQSFKHGYNLTWMALLILRIININRALFVSNKLVSVI
jgi:hypothetical protein